MLDSCQAANLNFSILFIKKSFRRWFGMTSLNLTLNTISGSFTIKFG